VNTAESRQRGLRNLRIPGLVTLVLAAMVMSADAGTFVSFNGKFHFTYPDTWQQIDYRTADYYLNQGRPADEKLDYEAVFADVQAYKVFTGQYLILTVDTIGELGPLEIDSVLDVMSGEFGRSVKRVAADSFLVRWDKETIAYDSVNQATAVISELAGDETGPRYSLMAVRFHKQGIANFFFYTPAAEFENGLPSYREMILSLSNEDLQAALPVEKAKVVDVEGGNTTKYVALFGGLLVIVLVIILAFRKKTGGRTA